MRHAICIRKLRAALRWPLSAGVRRRNVRLSSRLSVAAILTNLALAGWLALWPLDEVDDGIARGASYDWFGVSFLVAILAAPFLAVLSIVASLRVRPTDIRSIAVSLLALVVTAGEGVLAVNSFH